VRLSAWVDAFHAGLLLGGAFWLAVGTGIVGGLAVARVGVFEDLSLWFRGAPALAVPVAVIPTDSLLHGKTVYEIAFRFTDPKGKVHSGRCRTSDEKLAEKARFGVALPMKYDRAHPERSRVDGTRLSPYGAFVIAPILFALAGFAAVCLGFAGSLARRHVLVHGERADGRVVDVQVADSPLRRWRVYDVRYAFPGPGGELQGVSAEAEAPRSGTEVAVLFDPERPWRSVLPPDGAFL
jgi:hypothetical protein